MTEQRGHCERCRYWARVGRVAADDGIPSEGGECRRFPPAVIAHAQATKLGKGGGWPGGWPLTHARDWCGEFTEAPQAEVPADLLARSVGSLGLSPRTLAALRNGGDDLPILTLAQLVDQTAEALRSRHNLGQTSVATIRVKLAELGLRLKGE